MVNELPELRIVANGSELNTTFSGLGILHEAYDDGHTLYFGELTIGTDPLKSDSDGDGLGDGSEFTGATDALNPDTDGDGLLDGGDWTKDEDDWRYAIFMSMGIVIIGSIFRGENYKGTINTNPDSDGDGLPDGWETSYGLDPLHNGTEKYILKANFDYYTVSDVSGDAGPGGDPEGDGFTNSQEYGYLASPTSADSDGDGLIDGGNATISRSNWRFKQWESQGIPYRTASGYNVEFLGEGGYTTNRTNPDSDFDNATDGQELHGYNVIISWFEGEDLKSMNKTIYGHPWGAYKQPDNSTYLDVDEDIVTS